MITENTVYKVKNRSTSMVVYKIPETNIRREFQPGEVKSIPYGELEKLTWVSGGREILENFLQILEEDVTNGLNLRREPEYNMSEEQVKKLLLTGSLDAFLDALDFAPMGVIDLIKSLAVSLPLQDLNKRQALKRVTGFDVDAALAHVLEEKRDEKPAEAPAKAVRRVQPQAETGRRTAVEYKPEPVEEPVVIKKITLTKEETPTEE